MHRLWSVLEIATVIFKHLQRRDQARIIRVCRYFWEVAIPLVWEDLPDIWMLVELFLWDKGSTDLGLIADQVGQTSLLLNQADKIEQASAAGPDKLVPTDRLSVHGKHTRTISLTLDPDKFHDLELFTYNDPFLLSLPRLRTLKVTIGDLDAPAGAELLHSALYLPTLTSIQLFPMHALDVGSCEPLMLLTQAVAKNDFDELESLTIEFPIKGEIDLECLVEAVRSHQKLKRVEFGTIHDTLQLQEALKELPLLQTLRLGELYFPSSRKPPPPMVTTGFPSLLHLDLSATPTHLQRFLPSINSSYLETIDLEVFVAERYLSSRIGIALEELTRFTLLKEVKLLFEVGYAWEDVEPVLSCTRLTRFGLISREQSWIPINSSHLQAMKKAWPRLLDLTITNFDRPTTGEPLIRLADLFDLTKDLASLQKLHISFDGRQHTQKQTFDALQNGGAKPANTSLQLLDVGWSLKDSDSEACSNLGQQFVAWWPNLRGVQAPPGPKRRWQGVKDFVAHQRALVTQSLSSTTATK
ncbi:hypothetical protein FRC04_001545 [Tulasnella sp. 424]|nr:hypothetical protein FRC04_001545 [Tulasnella sp. 424]KAG8969088.1 hypothetical protein FRC05_001241 [Tulasnella sp. 425]